MAEFNIGARVRVAKPDDMGDDEHVGMIGTVTEFRGYDNLYPFRVRFDTPVGNFDGDIFAAEELELLIEDAIAARTKGGAVVAYDERIITVDVQGKGHLVLTVQEAQDLANALGQVL